MRNNDRDNVDPTNLGMHAHSRHCLHALTVFFSLYDVRTQRASSPVDRGKGQEVLGLYFHSVHHTLGDMFLLRRDPAELGVVDTPNRSIGADGSLR